jgi:Trypsin-co-occurring domain 1
VETVAFPLEGGGQVLVQVEGERTAAGGVVTRGGGRAGGLERAEQTFEGALGTIRVVAEGVLGQLAGMVHAPDEVNVEFGLELTAKAGTILVAAGTTAHLRVGLRWQPQPSQSGSSSGQTS